MFLKRSTLWELLQGGNIDESWTKAFLQELHGAHPSSTWKIKGSKKLTASQGAN